MPLTGTSATLPLILSIVVFTGLLLLEAETVDASPGGSQAAPERCAPAELSVRGEAMMAEMAGSARAHRQMNDAMEALLGRRELSAMHEMMGAASNRCRDQSTMANMGMSGTTRRAMMHGGSGARGGGGMMEGGGMMQSRSGTDWDTVALIVLLAALITALAALLLWRPWSARSRPASMVDERLARGEIDVEEHRRLRSALQR